MAVKEIPILFSTPMVQAILAGNKTMTRRILKPQPEQKVMGGSPMKALTAFIGEDNPIGWTWKGTRFMPWPEFLENNCCPYGKPGYILWVRETFAEWDNGGYAYKADGFIERYGAWERDTPKKFHDIERVEKWKPSIFMPKEACRIWLKVTDIGVERLQDITDGDVASEGVVWNEPLDFGREKRNCKSPAQRTFRKLWDKINGEESWIENPYVWVITFEKVNKP